jgi:phycocyanobilin lyase beta subunit
VRRAAARGLGSLDVTALDAAERDGVRERVLGALAAGCRDGEWVVRYAVVVGLESLTLPLPPGDRLRPHAEGLLRERRQPSLEDTPVVRLRADRALERLATGSTRSDPKNR